MNKVNIENLVLENVFTVTDINNSNFLDVQRLPIK